MITLHPSCHKTNNFEMARARLSKFVERQALHISRVTGINYEDSEEAPSTYEEVRQEFMTAKALNKPVRIYRGASDKTIYTSASVNWAFRFWHDYIHFYYELDFSEADELAVGSVQCAAVAAEFGLGSLEYRMMHQDTIGQVLYFAKTGEFIDDQLAFVQERLAT